MRELRSIFQSVRAVAEAQAPEIGRVQDHNATPADQKMVLAYDGSDAFLAYVPNELPGITIDFMDRQGLAGTKWPAEWRNARKSENAITDPCEHAHGTVVTVHQASGQLPVRRIANGTTYRARGLQRLGAADHQGQACQSTSGALIQVVTGAIAEQGGRWVTAQITDSAGTVLNEKVLNSDSAGSPGAPQVATETGGNSMVVWQDDDGSEHHDPRPRPRRPGESGLGRTRDRHRGRGFARPSGRRRPGQRRLRRRLGRRGSQPLRTVDPDAPVQLAGRTVFRGRLRRGVQLCAG